ncbi:MAG: type II toxin-antitoxin system VapC family toxin [Proteobacteria bacterium]|nr:type II toxin-antitoxin system VapC family toxin [Pseudomonadota bacterium]
MAGALLDTCAVIWLANGDPLSAAAREAIVAAGLADALHISPVSAWEIGMLSRPKQNRPALEFLPDPKTWFARLMAGPGIVNAPLTAAIAIDSSNLAGDLHADPGDRLIIATARHLNVPIITRDRRIIDYAKAGGVRAIAC